MVKENNIQNTFPPNSCYVMLNTVLGSSPKSGIEDLKRVGGGLYRYTVNVPNKEMAAIVGSLINSCLSRGRVDVKSFSYEDENDESFSIDVIEWIY